MSKFNKIICCLIMPVVMIMCFSGCGGKARTGEQIQNRYISMKVKHYDMFEGGSYDLEHDYGKKENAILLKDTLQVHYNKALTDNLNKISGTLHADFVNDENLYKRYYALKNIQDVVLKNVFQYYNAYSSDFYLNWELKDIKKEEMRKLYNNVEKLQKDIENFKVARDKFENSCDVLTFSGVIRADVTEYAYQYNMLIENSLNFVRYFKELNEKYYFNEPINEETSDDDKLKYVKYYYYESIFEISDMLYNIYLKASNNVNECDLSNLIRITNGAVEVKHLHGTSISYAAIYNEQFLDKINKINDVENPVVIEDASLNDFLQVRGSYLQKKRVYNVVYENMDYYKYNSEVLLGEESFLNYYSRLNNIEKANIELIKGFYSTTLDEYVNILIGENSLV